MEVYVIFTYNVYKLDHFASCIVYFRYEITSKTLKSTVYKVNVFCKIHEIWVKTFEDIAPRTVPDRQTDRLTWVFIELLAAAKMHKAWMTCEALYRHYTKNSWSDCTIHIWDIGMIIKWKHFPRYWPFVRGIHRSPVNSPHEGQWRGALMFSLICARINSWVNNGEAGDLRRHRAHYDVTVMVQQIVQVQDHLMHERMNRYARSYVCVPVTCNVRQELCSGLILGLRPANE